MFLTTAVQSNYEQDVRLCTRVALLTTEFTKNVQSPAEVYFNKLLDLNHYNRFDVNQHKWLVKLESEFEQD